MLKRLREVVKTRQELYFNLVDLQHAVENADNEIKKQLIEMNATEALTVNWSRLRRMIKE